MHWWVYADLGDHTALRVTLVDVGLLGSIQALIVNLMGPGNRTFLIVSPIFWKSFPMEIQSVISSHIIWRAIKIWLFHLCRKMVYHGKDSKLVVFYIFVFKSILFILEVDLFIIFRVLLLTLYCSWLLPIHSLQDGPQKSKIFIQINYGKFLSKCWHHLWSSPWFLTKYSDDWRSELLWSIQHNCSIVYRIEQLYHLAMCSNNRLIQADIIPGSAHSSSICHSRISFRTVRKLNVFPLFLPDTISMQGETEM